MELFWIIAIVALPFAIGGALFMDERLHKKNPDALPYKWGYYNGWMGIIISVIYAAIFFISAADTYGRRSDEYAALGFLFLILAVISAGFIFRNRWWSIASVIAQVNPLLWIINGIYIKNRWHEMSGVPNIPAFYALKSQSKATRALAGASIFWVVVASAFVFLFEPYGWRIDWGHFLKVLVFPPLVIVGGYFLYKKLIAEE